MGLTTLDDASAWPEPDVMRPPRAAFLVPGSGAAVVPLGPSTPGHAMVACDLVGQFLHFKGKFIAGVATCPRHALMDVEATLDLLGLTAQVGFEVEFRMLARDSGSGRAATGPPNYALASNLDAASPILDAIADACTEAGIEVKQYHGESGTGAFELVTGPNRPVAAVDALLYTRSIISSVAAAHGYRVTFAPKPVPGEAGLGAHAHISLFDPDKVNLIQPRPGSILTGPLDPEGRSFMAGILNRLDGLLALTAGSPSSFDRVQPGAWAGAHQRWGPEGDKEASLRWVGSGEDSRFEVKCLDGSANPYLALAGLIAAGLEGLKQEEPLQAPAAPVDRRSSSDEDSEDEDSSDDEGFLAARPPPGARLPQTVEAALKAFRRGEVRAALERYLDSDLRALVPAVRRADAAAAAALAGTEGGAGKLRASYRRAYS